MRYAIAGLYFAGTLGWASAQSPAVQPPGAQAPVAQAPVAQDQAGNQESTIKVNVDLVNILFAVRAKKGGQLIPNLEKNNFKVYEDGKEQTIQHFSRETDLPLTLGLLIDISASQENLVDIEREAAASFFSSVVRQKDEAFLISFGKDTNLLQDYTNSPRLLTSALRDLQPDGQTPMISGGPIPNVNTGPVPISGTPKGTLLFDAIYLASNEKLKSEVGRKAIILITDGDDQGSYYKIHDAIEAAQKADTIIYSIYYVDRGFYLQAGMMGGGGKRDLDKMSEETGGHVFTVNKKHPLSEVFKEIQEELRNQYAIGYEPTNAVRDGSFRHLEIKVDNPDDRVQARNGYYATPSGASDQ
jgi:VWFA-related protein